MKFVNNKPQRLLFPTLGLEVEAGAEFEVTDEDVIASLKEQGFIAKGAPSGGNPPTGGSGTDDTPPGKNGANQ